MKRRVIALRDDCTAETDACAGGAPYALRVLGDSMRPEFEHGDVVVVEPDGLASDGSYVIARSDGELMLRALRREAAGWRLAALAHGYGDVTIANLTPVIGVVIQKARPGCRRATKRYVD